MKTTEKNSQIWSGRPFPSIFPGPRDEKRAHSGCISLPAARRILMTNVKCIHYTDVGFPVPVNSVRPVDYCCCLTGHAHFRRCRNNFGPGHLRIFLFAPLCPHSHFSKKSAEMSALGATDSMAAFNDNIVDCLTFKWPTE